MAARAQITQRMEGLWDGTPTWAVEQRSDVCTCQAEAAGQEAAARAAAAERMRAELRESVRAELAEELRLELKPQVGPDAPAQPQADRRSGCYVSLQVRGGDKAQRVCGGSKVSTRALNVYLPCAATQGCCRMFINYSSVHRGSRKHFRPVGRRWNQLRALAHLRVTEALPP